ncbi:MAG: hypothetical protein EOP00_02685 [Pedobacter sp.]|nr:MAG: hypothetical protein EOP00_02685 [Pedobacter sp.]
MDFNDFSSRLKRTLASLNARFDDDIAVYFTHTKNENSDKFSFRAGNMDEEEIINKIFIILYNLSSLKDNLKNCLKKKNINPQIVEYEINNSLHLQVLIDLVNQEKHGYPLNKSNRSQKNPLITHAMQVMSLRTSAEPGSVAFMTFNEDGVSIQGDNSRMAIRATIFDDKNNPIFGLDELVDTCYEKFELLARTHNCC